MPTSVGGSLQVGVTEYQSSSEAENSIDLVFGEHTLEHSRLQDEVPAS